MDDDDHRASACIKAVHCSLYLRLQCASCHQNWHSGKPGIAEVFHVQSIILAMLQLLLCQSCTLRLDTALSPHVTCMLCNPCKSPQQSICPVLLHACCMLSACMPLQVACMHDQHGCFSPRSGCGGTLLASPGGTGEERTPARTAQSSGSAACAPATRPHCPLAPLGWQTWRQLLGWVSQSGCQKGVACL